MLVYGTCECFVMHMLYVCVHPVAVLNAGFCMTCSLLCWLTMQEATIWKMHTPEAVS